MFLADVNKLYSLIEKLFFLIEQFLSAPLRWGGRAGPCSFP